MQRGSQGIHPRSLQDPEAQVKPLTQIRESIPFVERISEGPQSRYFERVVTLLYRAATKNSIPAMSPWAIIPNIAALIPKSVRVAIPSITKPMSLRNAMRRFISLCETSKRAVNDANHSKKSYPWGPCDGAFGKEWNGDSHEPIGTQFQEHSGENDEPTVGAWVCASGSQV